MLATLDISEVKQRFDTDGYYIIPQLISPSVRAAVQTELETIVDFLADWLMQRGRISNPLKDEPFETRLAKLYQNNLDDALKTIRAMLHRPGLFDLLFCPELLDIIVTILGPEIRLYPNYSARPKFPDWAGTLVLWHQDGGYTEKMNGNSSGGSVDELRMVNVWTPLVPARVENGCMQFIPGTHKLGVVPHVRKEHYLEIEPQHLQPRLNDAVNIELDPGDVVIFHNLLFHCGLPNNSGTIRWSVDWRYQDATQPTMRKFNGHLARSRLHPDRVVRSPQQWAQLWLS